MDPNLPLTENIRSFVERLRGPLSRRDISVTVGESGIVSHMMGLAHEVVTITFARGQGALWQELTRELELIDGQSEDDHADRTNNDIDHINAGDGSLRFRVYGKEAMWMFSQLVAGKETQGQTAKAVAAGRGNDGAGRG